MNANAAIITSDQTQTINGPINAPTVFSFDFATPTSGLVGDATLTTTSLGDWSYAGNGSLAASESMSVSAEGNLLIDDLFRFDSGLDVGSPAKNDNSRAIFQTITIPQAVMASLMTDGLVSLVYTPRFNVNISSAASFLTARLVFDYDDAQAVPESGTFALMGLGLLGLMARRRQQRS